jgi:hypothetical protein
MPVLCSLTHWQHLYSKQIELTFGVLYFDWKLCVLLNTCCVLFEKKLKIIVECMYCLVNIKCTSSLELQDFFWILALVLYEF